MVTEIRWLRIVTTEMWTRMVTIMRTRIVAMMEVVDGNDDNGRGASSRL